MRSAPVSAADTAEPPQASSNGLARIRIDNDLDLAIIEYRSSDTGDVLRQYPTEAQIQAFSRASELDVRSEAVAAAPAEPAQGEAAPDVAATVPDVPAPATAAEAAPASAVNITAGGESVPTYTAATQSVTV